MLIYIKSFISNNKTKSIGVFLACKWYCLKAGSYSTTNLDEILTEYIYKIK